MLLLDAKRLADTLIPVLAPYCDRVEVAGSIRRGKADVKDIELVLIPRWEVQPFADGLFVDTHPVNTLHQFVSDPDFLKEVGVQWIKPSVDGVVPWSVKPDGKYWRGYLPDQDIKLDVFLCTPQNFGNQLLVRTGPAEYSEAVVTHAKRIGYPFKDGRVWKGERPLDLPEERDVFTLLHLPYVDPTRRSGTKGEAA